MHKDLIAKGFHRRFVTSSPRVIFASGMLLAIGMTACSARATPTLSPTSSPTAQPVPTDDGALKLGNWHDMIYHEQVARLVLVNGGPEQGKSPTEPVELWGWYGDNWSLLSADPNGPRWRNFASIAYDSNRKVLILDGGLTAEQDYTDTWEWDGETWTRFAVEGPGPREAAGMTYDSDRERVVLFGGAQRGRMMNDIWEWDGVQWTKFSAEGPSARFPAGFVYDTARQNVMLFGGHAFDGQAFTTFGDTWTWDGRAWKQITSRGPSPRDGARAIFVSTSNQVLLFGGAEIDKSVTVLNDTWLWDGAQWTRLDVSGPPARAHAAMAFDAARGVVLMTGGANSPNAILPDTWEWDGETWRCADGCQ